MTTSFKALVLGLGVVLGMTTATQAAQQPQYQSPMTPMGQGMQFGMMDQGMQAGMMRQAGSMMNDPQIRAQMQRMSQGCGDMMAVMGNRMPPTPNRH